MLHWSLVRLAHCLLVIALNYVYYFEQINMMMMVQVQLLYTVYDFIINKNLCGRDGRTICGPQCVPKSTSVSL